MAASLYYQLLEKRFFSNSHHIFFRTTFLETCDRFLEEFNIIDQNCELFNFEASMKEENQRLIKQQKDIEQS